MTVEAHIAAGRGLIHDLDPDHGLVRDQTHDQHQDQCLVQDHDL